METVSRWLDIAVISVSFLGGYTLVNLSLRFLRWVWSAFLRPPKNLYRDYGSWAVITGCTDGIGKALAFKLASKGLNLVLVGRNPSKLEATSDKLREKYGTQIEIKCIEVDFARMSGEEVERRIKQGIEGLDVGVLINNAGLANTAPIYFHEQELANVEDVIRVNAAGTTWATRAVLPGMISKRRGAIVNIGSGSTVVPSYPLSSIYSCTKMYLARLSKCLSVEYKHYGIDIQCQTPFTIATKMVRIRQSSFFIPSPEEFSEASVRWIGYDRQCQPYWTHAVQCYLLRLLPDAVFNWFVLRKNLAMRKKAIQRGRLKLKQDDIRSGE